MGFCILEPSLALDNWRKTLSRFALMMDRLNLSSELSGPC